MSGKTNTAEILAERSRKRAERPAGEAEPDSLDNCYRVTPGDGRDEYWAALPPRLGIENLNTALARAQMLSRNGPPQHVIRVTDGTPKTICWYSGGQMIRPVRTGGST